MEEEGLKVLRARMTPVSLPDSVARGYREKKKKLRELQETSGESQISVRPKDEGSVQGSG